MPDYIGDFKIAKYNIYNLPEGQKYSTCPLCSASRKKKTEKCATIYWEHGFLKCSHCGEVVQIHEWAKKETKTEYAIPKWTNNTQLSENVVKFFESRKISQFVLRLMRIGEGIESMPDKDKWIKKNTIQFPYIRYGEVINVKYRAGDKTFKLSKDAEKMPYNLDNIIGQEVIYCVEGEMDVLAVMECGIHNVTSPPNGFTKKGNINLDWLNNDVEHFLKADKIILAFDNDEPGENGKKEFIRRFGAHKCFVVDLKDCKDSNEYSIKYGKEELKKALEDHKEIPLEGVSSYKDVKQKVRDFFLNGMPRGLVTGKLFDLDRIFSVNFGHLLLITGVPTSGKSEVTDEIVIGYALKYGYKTAFASPENKPNEIHQQKLLKKLNGIPPTKKDDFNDSFESCERFSDEHFTMIDIENGYDLERVLLKTEELIYRKGIRILVIDPFNKVNYKGKVESITGNRTNDYTRTYLSILDNFATKHDILIILVAHPNKMEKLKNGQRAVPDFYDVKGGGEFYDMCHHGLVVDRDYLRGLTLIRTLKVKFSHLGQNNKDAWFKFNVNNGRMTHVSGNVDDPESLKFEYDNDNWVVKNTKTIETKMEFKQDDIVEKWKIKETEDVPF